MQTRGVEEGRGPEGLIAAALERWLAGRLVERSGGRRTRTLRCAGSRGAGAGAGAGAFRATSLSAAAHAAAADEDAYLRALEASAHALPPSMGGPGARTPARG